MDQISLMPDLNTQPIPRIMHGRDVRISARNVNIYYGDKHAIKDLSVEIPDRAVSAFIGPSGCGKSTFLRAINRMNDTIPSCRMTGDVLLDGSAVSAGAVLAGRDIAARARTGSIALASAQVGDDLVAPEGPPHQKEYASTCRRPSRRCSCADD